MKELFVKIILFTLPFFFYLIGIVIVDPFNYFDVCHFIPEDVKIKAIREDPDTLVRNVALFKIISFSRNPNAQVIIGDSRSQWLDQKTMDIHTGKPYFNFGVPGLNFRGMAEVFWFCNSKVKVQDVIWGCGFYNFTDSWGDGRSIFSESLEIYGRPVLFFVRKSMIQATFRVAMQYWKVQHNKEQIDEQTVSVAERNFSAVFIRNNKQEEALRELQSVFENIDLSQYSARENTCKASGEWEKMEKKQDSFLRGDRPSEELNELMSGIGRYADSNNIALHFVVFPDHIDYQRLILKNDKMGAKWEFISLLNHLGDLFYYDFPNNFTQDRCNYTDLFHLNKKGYKIVTDALWGESPMFCIKMKRQYMAGFDGLHE